MKELELTLKIRNNRLKARRDALGLSQADLAAAVGIETQTYGRLEGMRDKPTRGFRDYRCRAQYCGRNHIMSKLFCREHMSTAYVEREREEWLRLFQPRNITVWTDAAQRLSSFYEVEPEELFPAAVQDVKVTSVTKTFDVEELQRGLGIDLCMVGTPPLLPDAQVRKTELIERVQANISTLTSGEEEVIRRRFGIGREEQTYSEIGDEFGKSRERVRQIEQRALRKLRHPTRSKVTKILVQE